MDFLRMDQDKSERILSLTLEIIYLLTGEDYTAVIKRFGECETPRNRPCVSGGLSRTQSPVTVPPPHSLSHGRNNDQKNLEPTNKIIQLVTGEVPVRCQGEEWENLEDPKSLYMDIMMENLQPLTSMEGSSNRLIPERYLRPHYSQDCTEENYWKPQEYQDDVQTDIKVEIIEGVEETYVRGDQQCEEEEISTDISTADGCKPGNISEGHLILSTDFEMKDDNITQDSPREIPITLNILPILHSADKSSDSPNPEECSASNDIVSCSTFHKNDRIFPCSECEKCYTRKSKLVIHQRTHTGEKPFPCSECGKCFTQKSSLVEHQKSHTGEKQFPCFECGKCFTQKSNLIIHRRNHTGEKPFPCAECDRCFKQKSVLIRHQRSHTGEKPFPCSECGKCFAQKPGLVEHQRSHTGVKPFRCSECGKCFTQKSNLMKHQRSHKGEKPFPCSECGKCFTQKSHLMTHQKTHTGEKPFPCNEGKWFTNKLDLLEYQKIHIGQKQLDIK